MAKKNAEKEPKPVKEKKTKEKKPKAKKAAAEKPSKKKKGKGKGKAEETSPETAVAAAVGQYTAWQRAIGRDINPSKLGEMVMAAGAKRVEMAAPVHQIVGAKSVAVLNGQAVHYGGLEDD